MNCNAMKYHAVDYNTRKIEAERKVIGVPDTFIK